MPTPFTSFPISTYEVDLEQFAEDVEATAQNAEDAQTAATSAAASAATATTQASSATTSAATATAQAVIATTQATIATTQAGISTAQAVIAMTKAAEAAASAAATATYAEEATVRKFINEFSELATKFVYASPAEGQEVVVAGNVVVDEKTGSRWEVLASGASGAHLDYTGAGGVKFLALPFRPGAYHVAQVGAVGSGDEAAIIQAFADAIPEFSRLHFDGTKTYTLNVTTSNHIVFEVNGATLVNATNAAFILAITPSALEITEHEVTEATLLPGVQTFTVTGASALFDPGDIGVLWDNALRPSDDEEVNFECVKIQSVSGDVVTLEAPTEGHKGAGTIVFRHSSRQIKDAGIRNARVRPTAGHTFACLYINHVDRPVADGNDIEGSTGPAFSLRHCYDLRCGDTFVRNPRSATSGNGYGVQTVACTGGIMGATIAHGCRHALDHDSSFRLDCGHVIDMDAQSVPVALRHTGFGGKIRVRGVTTKLANSGTYVVSDSSQGYGVGANRALAANHIARGFDVDFVDVQYDFSPNDSSTAVYFTNGADGVSVGPIRFKHLDGTALASGSVSFAVRVDGPIGSRGLNVASITGDKVQRVFARADDLAATGEQGIVNIGSINISTAVGRIVWFRGGGSVNVGSWFAGGNIGETLFDAPTLGSNTPRNLSIGPGQYLGTDTLVLAGAAGVDAIIAPIWKSVGTALSSPNGATYTATQIQNRSALVRIAGDVGSGTDAISTFPAPTFDGQRICVQGKFSGRNDVTIPASVSSTGSTIVFNSTTPFRELMGYNGLWVPLG